MTKSRLIIENSGTLEGTRDPRQWIVQDNERLTKM